ncbi:MAG: RIP metalloprotease RseP [Ruminococcus sp.]|nr:RIP metalloprotease RseP [Ruminococcus sp.]
MTNIYKSGDDFITVITTILLILIAVLLFEMIIFFHELGHFITAKKSGVKVNEFALGMGPKIFSFVKGETTYSLRAFPIGGFCAMEGEDEESNNPRSFNNAKIWKRMIIIIAGAFMNIVFGLILMFVTVIPQDAYASTQVSQFVPYSFSAVSGLQQGDKIVNINGYAINTSTDFSFALYTLPVTEVDGTELTIYKEDCAYELYTYLADYAQEQPDDETFAKVYEVMLNGQQAIAATQSKDEAYQAMCTNLDEMAQTASKEKLSEYPQIEERETRQRFRTDMSVIRDGERVDLKGVDFFTGKKEGEDKPTLSIDFYVEPIEKTFGSVISQTFGQTVSVVRMVWGSLIGLLKGQFGLNELSGPIGIASALTEVAGEAMKTSGFGTAVSTIVYVMMVISVNLGIINMLPFPALDGGRFLMLLIEWIFRKPVPRKVEKVINAVGLVLLLGLSAVIAVKDVFKLFTG